jgi:hypothetical protein
VTVIAGAIALLAGVAPAAEMAPRVGAVATPNGNPGLSATPSPNPASDASPQATGTADERTLPPTGPREPGRLENADQRLAVWEDSFGAVRAEVVVTVRNTGGSPLRIALSTARWTVTDEEGGAVASGRFAHAFPPVVEPGAEAYLIDGVSAAFAEAGELAKLEVEVEAESEDDDDRPVALTVADVDWTTTDDGGVVVSGRVENPSTDAITDAKAAVVLRNDRDEILAAVYDVAVGPMAAGESRTFDTAYPGTPPVDADDVATVVAIATGDPGTTANAE